MSGRYAKTTEVSVEKTRVEIEQVLRRYGADAFGYTLDGRHAQIAFRLNARHYRLSLTLPDLGRADFHTYKQGSVTFRRAEGVAEKLWEQECRSYWRALLLVIGAKLEAAELGISTLEDEFLAATVLSDRTTVGERMKPQLAEHYRIGGPPTLMLEGRK